LKLGSENSQGESIAATETEKKRICVYLDVKDHIFGTEYESTLRNAIEKSGLSHEIELSFRVI